MSAQDSRQGDDGPRPRLLRLRAKEVLYMGALSEHLGHSPPDVAWEEATVHITVPILQTTGYVKQTIEVPLLTLAGYLAQGIQVELEALDG